MCEGAGFHGSGKNRSRLFFWDCKSDIWEVVFFFAKLCGIKSSDPGVTPKDRHVSEMVMKLWANFAKSGNPGIKGVVNWPAYQETTDQYLYIADSLEVKSGFSRIAQK